MAGASRWKLDRAEVRTEGMSTTSGGRSRVRQSRALDTRSRSMALVHGPTGLRVEGAIAAGNYSRKDLQLQARLLEQRLFGELEQLVARSLRVPGRSG